MKSFLSLHAQAILRDAQYNLFTLRVPYASCGCGRDVTKGREIVLGSSG